MVRDDRWVTLGQEVTRRRVDLGWRTRQALVEATGLSRKTLGEIERGDRTSYDPATLLLLEKTLRWAPGHIDGIVGHLPAAYYLINEVTGERLLPSRRPVPEGLQDIAWFLDDDSQLTDTERADLGAALKALARTYASLLARSDRAPVVVVEESEVRGAVGRRR